MGKIIKYTITDLCNGSCDYCSFRNKIFKDEHTISLDQIEDSFDKLWPLFGGFEFIHLFGGEPTLFPQLMNCIEENVKKWVLTSGQSKPIYIISTNLLKVEPLVEEFIERNINNTCFVLSIDSNCYLHDTYRQSKSFKKIIDNAKELKEKNVPIFNITAVLHKKYFEYDFSPYIQAKDIIKTLKPETFTFNKIITDSNELYLNDKEYYKLLSDSCYDALKDIKNGTFEDRNAGLTFLGFIPLASCKDNEYFCNFGIDSISIMPGGYVDTCPDMSFFKKEYRIKLSDKNFKSSILNLINEVKINNLIGKEIECRDCTARYLCHICPMWSNERKKMQCCYQKLRHNMFQEIETILNNY